MTNRNQESSQHLDPETINRKQRIKAIHDARQHVHEKMSDAYDAWVSDQVDKILMNTIVRQSIERYIMEVEALVKSDEDREATYWQNYELGEMELPTQVVQFNGLESILDAPEFIEDSWEETVVSDTQGKDTKTRTVQRQISMDILMNAYRATNAFCADVGLDIDVQEAQEFEFDYSDIAPEAEND